MTRVVLLACLVAHTAYAGEVTSSGPLSMRASDDVVLGRDSEAVIELARAPARLVASTGDIGAPVADGTRWRATLRLPALRTPRVAIVAALDERGELVDWLAIPLAGQARVKVQTEPRASVVVHVADREIGPTIADLSGVATVPLIVPPGVHEARAIATAASGVTIDKPLALGLKAFPRTLALCFSDHVAVIAVDETGRAASSAPAIRISAGKLGATTAKAPGVFAASLEPDGDEVTIATSFAKDDVNAATCRVVAAPEAPALASVTASRTRFVAGTGAIELRVELAYLGKQRPIEPVLAWSSDFGTIGELHREGSVWTARWSLPDAFGVHARASAKLAVTWPGGRLEREITVALAAARPAHIEVKAPSPLRADGEATTEIVARLSDRFGNSAGTLSRVYRAPRSRIATDDVVDLRDDASGIAAHVRVPLEPLPRRYLVAVRLGYLSNLARVSAPLVSMSADIRLPVLDERLVVGGELAAYHASDAAMASDGTTLAMSLTSIPALARAAFRVRVSRFDVWAGGGAGLAFVMAGTSSPATGQRSEGGLHPAASLFAGAATRGRWGMATLELAVLHTSLTGGPVQGQVGGVTLALGYGREL